MFSSTHVCVFVFIVVGFVCQLSLCSAANIPFTMEKVPDQIKEFMPEEVVKFYDDMTADEREIMKELAANHASYANEDEVLEALKAKSPKLYDSAKKLHDLAKDRYNKLIPEAKTFIDDCISKVRALKPKDGEKPDISKIREEANAIIEKYQALGEAAKESLKENFPKITSVVMNEKFQNLAKGLLKKDAAPAA